MSEHERRIILNVERGLPEVEGLQLDQEEFTKLYENDLLYVLGDTERPMLGIPVLVAVDREAGIADLAMEEFRQAKAEGVRGYLAFDFTESGKYKMIPIESIGPYFEDDVENEDDEGYEWLRLIVAMKVKI